MHKKFIFRSKIDIKIVSFEAAKIIHPFKKWSNHYYRSEFLNSTYRRSTWPWCISTDNTGNWNWWCGLLQQCLWLRCWFLHCCTIQIVCFWSEIDVKKIVLTLSAKSWFSVMWKSWLWSNHYIVVCRIYFVWTVSCDSRIAQKTGWKRLLSLSRKEMRHTIVLWGIFVKQKFYWLNF